MRDRATGQRRTMMQLLTPKTSFQQPQWVRAARWPLATQLYLGLWFWAFIIFAWIVAVVVFNQLGTIEMSIMQFVQHGALWFPFSISIAVALLLIQHIANGLTRRSYARATVVVSVVVALLYGVLIATAMSLEGLIYDAAGWSQQHVTDAAGDGPVGTAGAPWTAGWPVSAVLYSLRTAGGLISGLLIGVTYYRFGGLKGTLLLPLTVLPALASQADLARLMVSGIDSALTVQILLPLTATVIATVAYVRLVRSLAITKKWNMHGE